VFHPKQTAYADFLPSIRENLVSLNDDNSKQQQQQQQRRSKRLLASIVQG
jgi:hypothetical protein